MGAGNGAGRSFHFRTLLLISHYSSLSCILQCAVLTHAPQDKELLYMYEIRMRRVVDVQEVYGVARAAWTQGSGSGAAAAAAAAAAGSQEAAVAAGAGPRAGMGAGASASEAAVAPPAPPTAPAGATATLTREGLAASRVGLGEVLRAAGYEHTHKDLFRGAYNRCVRLLRVNLPGCKLGLFAWSVKCGGGLLRGSVRSPAHNPSSASATTSTSSITASSATLSPPPPTPPHAHMPTCPHTQG